LHNVYAEIFFSFQLPIIHCHYSSIDVKPIWPLERPPCVWISHHWILCSLAISICDGWVGIGNHWARHGRTCLGALLEDEATGAVAEKLAIYIK
jgi:hypothetical protein